MHVKLDYHFLKLNMFSVVIIRNNEIGNMFYFIIKKHLVYFNDNSIKKLIA